MKDKFSVWQFHIPTHKAVSLMIDCFLKRHHLGIMMFFGGYSIGHIKAHSIVVK